MAEGHQPETALRNPREADVELIWDGREAPYRLIYVGHRPSGVFPVVQAGVLDLSRVSRLTIVHIVLRILSSSLALRLVLLRIAKVRRDSALLASPL